MKMTHMQSASRKIISVLLLVMLLVSAFCVSAFASDQYFYFNMTNTGTTSYVYTNTYNTKVYANDNATIKCGYTNAPGWGYRLSLVNSSYVQSTYERWFNSSGTSHPPYYTGMGATNVKYYMSGRIDNDYSGTYMVYGYYNADYT